MQPHIDYLGFQIRSLEQKQALCGVDTARECTMLRDLLTLAHNEDQRRASQLPPLPCHLDRLHRAPRLHYADALRAVPVDVLDFMLRRFLIETEVMCLSMTSRAHHARFRPLYLELVAPRRQRVPVPVVGTHTRHFWYTVPALVGAQQPQRMPRLVEQPHTEVEYSPLHALTQPKQAKITLPVGWNSRGASHDRCYRCQKPGHLSRDCPTVPCKTCQRRGHFETDCPQRVRSFRLANK
jgi:hypothetical protein